MAGISNRFSIYIAGGRILSMLAGFIMPVVLVRVMSQEDYGLTSQFLTLYTSIYTIAALGIHSSVFYFCPSASKESSNKYITNTFFLLLIFGLIIGFVLFIPPIKYTIFGNSKLGHHSDLIILSIALATVMNAVSPLNTIRQDKWGALLFPGLVAFGRIGTIVFSAIFYKDIHQMFLMLFIFQCIITIAVLIYTRYKTKFVLDFKLMKEQLIYSLPFGLAVALQLFSNYFDKFVCIRMLTPTEYAVYGIAFLSIPGINQIFESLCQVNIVNMSNSYRNGNKNDILPQYGNFVIKSLSFSVPLILIVSLFSEEIISFLYTESYSAAAPYFRIYSLTFITYMLGAGTILRSIGKTKQSMYAYLVTCLIGLPCTYFLIHSFGTPGAICGAIINIIFPRIIQMGYEIKATNSSFTKFLPWRTIAVIFSYSMIFLVPFIIIKYACHINIGWCIIESIVYVFIVYFILIQKDIFIISQKSILSYINKFKK